MPELITELQQRPPPPFAPRSGQPEVRPRMLFAAGDFVQALPALRRAQSLAERAGAELYVLQVGRATRTPQTPAARSGPCVHAGLAKAVQSRRP